ncbi:MAG TPA: PilZ domain-containing protein [Bdellovibrio sp.]|nr:PilZ domain-containing protein [Bdellovibrio sp.]
MKKLESFKDVIYLSLSQSLPSYLTSLPGVRWHLASSKEKLKLLLKTQKEVCVIVQSDFLNVRQVQAFLSWIQIRQDISFIFIARNIEDGVYKLNLKGHPVFFLKESESDFIPGIVTRCLRDRGARGRRQERCFVQSSVMLKKSTIAYQSPTGGGVQFLREGRMKDFSPGGAQILCEGRRSLIAVKDFLNLIYQDRSGKWVSIETQVRWIASSAEGQQIIGVQFLAMSA